MPYPVLHSFAGYTLYRLSGRNQNPDSRNLPDRILCALTLIVLASAADLDFAFGFFLHQGARFHRGISHSLMAAVLAAAVTTWMVFGIRMIRDLRSGKARFRRGRYGLKFTRDPNGGNRNFQPLKYFFFCLLAYASHLFLDALSGRGVPLFWPLTARLVNFPAPVFLTGGMGCHLMATRGFLDFFGFIISPSFWKTMFFESALAVYLWIVWNSVWQIKRLMPPVPVVMIRLTQVMVFVAGMFLL